MYDSVRVSTEPLENRTTETLSSNRNNDYGSIESRMMVLDKSLKSFKQMSSSHTKSYDTLPPRDVSFQAH